MDRKKFGIAVLLVLAVVAGILAFRFGRDNPINNKPVASDFGKQTGSNEDKNRTGQGKIKSGKNPGSVSGFAKGAKPKTDNNDYFTEIYGKVGKIQAVRADANPQVAALYKAFAAGDYEQTSSFFAPKVKFDPAILKDKTKLKKYVSTPVLGRIWEIKKPSAKEKVKSIRRLSDQMTRLKRGESATLKVLAAPGAPVTFTSFDASNFSNGIGTVTVVADKRGIARADFSAASGTYGSVRILAGSPLCSEQVAFTVEVVKE